MTTANNIAPGLDAEAPATLRSLASDPPNSIAGAIEIAERQAQLLRDLLPDSSRQITDCLTDTIPQIRIDYLDDIPVPGCAFWGHGYWNIHVRASDPADAQDFTVLHELKHIIDHPLRRQCPNLFSEAEWEGLANYFADHVLATAGQDDRVKRKEEHHERFTHDRGDLK